LAGPQAGVGVGVEVVPGGVPLADHYRAVGLGETVEMGDLAAELLHAAQDGWGGRGAAGEDSQSPPLREGLGLGGIADHRQHRRRPAQCGDPLGVDLVPDLGRLDPRAQTWVAAAAVADQVKHHPLQ